MGCYIQNVKMMFVGSLMRQNFTFTKSAVHCIYYTFITVILSPVPDRHISHPVDVLDLQQQKDTHP